MVSLVQPGVSVKLSSLDASVTAAVFTKFWLSVIIA